MTIKPIDAWTRAEKDAARAILLEPSPYETDGGELIGRDPRKIPVEQLNRAGLEGHPLLTVIRSKCLNCACQQESEVRKCVLVTCPNWPFRVGTNPFRAPRELTDEQRERRSSAIQPELQTKANSPGMLPPQLGPFLTKREDRSLTVTVR